MAGIALDHVSKIYPGDVVAVRDLSLRVADGELVVLVGPSGCGKTTTLRMIAGLEQITAGTIHIGDRVVNAVHPKDRDVAMVFQDYALYPHMSVYKNMAFALKLRKIRRADIERRVRHTAQMLGITDLLNRMPRALSGGQQQRVAVGRAVVRDPKCALFDEPLSNLDAQLRTQMRGELKSLHMRLQTTIVYVTHDQEEAMTLGDRIAVMSHGIIQQIGPPLQVYRKPVNRFVAGFLGTPPMNFIDGHVQRKEDRLWFADGHGLRMGLARETAASAADCVDRAVVLGVRPEALRPAPPGGSTGDACAVTIEVAHVEPLGDRVDVYGKTASGAQMTARVPAREGLSAGVRLPLSIDPAGLHLFEPGECGRHVVFGRAGQAD